MPLPSLSLSQRSFIVLAICAGVLGFAGTQVYQKLAYEHERGKLSVKIATASVRLSNAMRTAARVGDTESIRSIISAFAGTPEVTCVTVNLTKQKLTEHWPDKDCVRNNPGLFLHRQPIRQQLRVLGEAKIYFTDSFIKQSIHDFKAITAGGILFLLGIMLFAIQIQQRIMINRPINKITRAFASLGDGEERTRIGGLAASPEFQTISNAFDAMADDLEQRGMLLRKQAAELAEKNHEINQSLDYGAMIQRSLTGLDPAYRDTPFDIAAVQAQLAQIGGDYYAGLDLKDRYVLFFADATGHGIPGALATMLLASALRNVAGQLAPDAGPAIWLAALHAAFIEGLTEQTGSKKDIQLGADCILMILEKSMPVARWASAKQPLFVKKGTKVEVIAPDKVSIGYGQEPVTFAEEEALLAEKGDMIVMCTDGIFDQPGGEKQFGFGKKRISRLCETFDGKETTAQVIAETIFGNVQNYAGDAEPLDDRSIAVILRR